MKAEAKKRRSEDKRKMTIAKKAVRATIKDYAEIAAKASMNDELEKQLREMAAKNKSLEEEVKSLREQLAAAENRLTNGQVVIQQAVEICQNEKVNDMYGNVAGDKITSANMIDTTKTRNLDLSHDIESDEHLNHLVKVSTENEKAEQRHQELMRKQRERDREQRERDRRESARLKAEHEANLKAEEQRKKQIAEQNKQDEIAHIQQFIPQQQQQPKCDTDDDARKMLEELGL